MSDGSSTFVEGPRAARITTDDHGAVLSMITWYTAVVMILAVGTRIIIKTFRSLGKDDPPIVVALIFAIAQVIVVSQQVHHGFGRMPALVTETQMVDIRRDGFILDILLIPTLFFAKLSAILFILQLLASRIHVRTAWGICTVITLWALSSIFVVGFQCGSKSPWETEISQCIDTVRFWTIFEAFNIFIDTVLIALPAYVIAKIQMRRHKKIVVILAFSFRGLAIASSACRIVYLRSTKGSADWTFDLVMVAICTQVESSLNIITTCIPFMKAFMDAFDSGRLGVAPHRTTVSGSKGSRDKSSNFLSIGSGPSRSRQGSDAKALKFRDDQVLHQTVIASGSQTDLNEDTANGSFEDDDRSDKMIIQQTRVWTVRYESAQPQVDGWKESGESSTAAREL